MVLLHHRGIKHLVFHIALYDRRAAADQRRAQQDADDGLPGLHRQQPDDGRRYQRDERRHLDLTADQHNQRAPRRQRKPGTGIRSVLYAERQIQRHCDKGQGERVRIQHGGGQPKRQTAGQHEHGHQPALSAGESFRDAQNRAHAENIEHSLCQRQREKRLRHAEGEKQLVKAGQHEHEAPLV